MDFKPNEIVIYCKGKPWEERGVVTSTNDKYVFVRYGSDLNSKATDPNDLEKEYETKFSIRNS